MSALFRSFMQGGFECSTHRRPDGASHDLLVDTGHALHPGADYAALARYRIRTVRDGLRWHLIETTPGQYDWSSFLPMLRASQDHGMQVIWDLCHYGYPADVDPFSPAFPDRFARFAAAAASVIRDESDDVPWYCPVNEISYWSWAGGDMAHFGPMGLGRGSELKRQLVRATCAGIAAIRQVDPRARFMLADPVINVAPLTADDVDAAEHATQGQYEAWDMIAGARGHGLGGRRDNLDVIGVNFYSHNQWRLDGPRIERGESDYRPFRELLMQVHNRYQRPILIAETGAEGDLRVPWLRYVCDEVAAARSQGADIHGICLYPVTDYPGWFDGRHCPTGMVGYPDAQQERPVYLPLAREMLDQQARFTPAPVRYGVGQRIAGNVQEPVQA